MTATTRPEWATHRVGDRVRRTWAKVGAVPGLRKDVLAVLVVLVVGVAITVTILGKQVGTLPWDDDRRTVRAEFAQAVAVNLSKRQDVRVAGVPVGRITDVEPTSQGTAVVSLSVDRDVPVYRDATAAMRPMNPLNEMYVDIDPGTAKAGALGERTIPSRQTTTPTQADQILAHLDSRTQAALTNLLAESQVGLANAETDLPAGLAAADGTVKDLQPVAEALAQRRDKIATLVTSLSQITDVVGTNDARLADLLDSTQKVLGTTAEQDDDVRTSLNKLPKVTHDLNAAMSSTSDLTQELNPVLRNLGRSSDELPKALDRVDGLVDTAGGTLPKIRPVVKEARPVVSDLGTVVPAVDRSLVDLRPVTRRLDSGTKRLVRDLDGIAAFVYNSAGLTVARDTNGTMVRGQLTIDVLEPLGVDRHGCAPLPSYLPCLPGGLR